MGGLAEVAPFLAYAGASRRPSGLGTARLGGALFFTFHYVGLIFDVRTIAGGGAAPGAGKALVPPAGRLALSLALMTGTAVAGWLLWLGGRAVARHSGGPAWARGLHGAKLAVPYALATFGASYGITVRGEIPSVPGAALGGFSSARFTVRPDHLEALLFPLAIAAVAAFAGAFSTQDPARSETSWEQRARAALAGSGRMLGFGLAFAFAGLLGMAAVNPNVTAAYFRGAFRPGATTGLALVGLNGLASANMAAWVLYPAMGSCVELSAGSGSACVLSYGHLPPGGPAILGTGAGLPHYPAAPGLYLLFLAVPALAVVLGGAAAARRAHAGTALEKALDGALAGALFGVLSVGVLFLSGVELASGGTQGTITLRPNPLVAAGLAAVWGIAGGALGGLVSPAPRPTEPPEVAG